MTNGEIVKLSRELIAISNSLLSVSDKIHREVKLLQEKIMRELNGEETEGHDEPSIVAG